MSLKVERIDHLGIVAGIIDDLKLVEQIDKRLPPGRDEKVSTGQSVAAMLLCGLGFSDRPLSLTPQFFESYPIGLLLNDEELKAEYFNHYKLGRSLDEIYEYGCSELFAELSTQICQQEKVEKGCVHLDSTSLSVSGAYASQPDGEEIPVTLTYGYSRDHRPDLKQIVQELLVSEDGGIPLWTASWSGNSNDSEIFRHRTEALVKAFEGGDGLKCLVADSKLYAEPNQVWLSQLPFVTRVPALLKREREVVQEALNDTTGWQNLDEQNYFKEFQEGKERWIVVFSDMAENRSQQRVEREVSKEAEKLSKQLKKLQSKVFGCIEDGEAAARELFKSAKYHRITELKLEPENKYTQAGRPSKTAQRETLGFRLALSYEQDSEAAEEQALDGSCYVLATNTAFSAHEVVRIYKGQNKVERGFRFLKDPLFFTSAFFLKKPERIQALLMVMVLALLIYNIAERRLRTILAALNETLPNQIKQQTSTPTLRWVFQLMGNISRVNMHFPGQNPQIVFDGLNETRNKVIKLFGTCVAKYYSVQV